jgi:hypothetical protein
MSNQLVYVEEVISAFALPWPIGVQRQPLALSVVQARDAGARQVSARVGFATAVAVSDTA